MNICLHQGSGLSPYLFARIMVKFTANIQEDIPKCILLAGDIVLADESIDGVNVKIERWRETLESNVFKISHTSSGGPRILVWMLIIFC